MKNYPFKDNTEKSRYELDLGAGNTALINYRVTPEGNIALTYTEVPREFENQGVGGHLVSKCLEDIQARGVKVIPRCGFVASYIRRHPEWSGLVEGY